jgi:hypothetical protein
MSDENKKKAVELALKRWADDEVNRQERVKRYATYFTHVYIEQWAAKDIPAGQRPKITLFLSADVIRQYRAKLFPAAAELGIQCYDEPGEKTKKTSEYEQHILDTYEKNQMPLILHDQSELYFIGGEACIYAPHDPVNVPGKAEAKIYSLNPCDVTIGIYGAQKVYGMHEQTITAQQARRLEWCTISDDIPDSQELSDIYYFDLYNYVRVINNDVNCAKVLPNPYARGYEVPYFWIPNNSKPGSTVGNSEVRHLVVLDKELNFRVSDYAERLRNGVLGPVFVSGASPKTNISLDADYINYLAAGGKAERLSLAGDGNEYLEYFNFLLDIYQKKTTITDDVLGTKNVNANMSGVALQYKFLSLQELIDEKRIVWNSQLKALNRQILYYKFGAGIYRNKPIYANVIPNDEVADARTNIALVKAGLRARESAIDVINPNESVAEIVKKIQKDAKLNPQFYLQSKKDDTIELTE